MAQGDPGASTASKRKRKNILKTALGNYEIYNGLLKDNIANSFLFT